MPDVNPLLDLLITEGKDFPGDFYRFCLSDQVAVNLDTILQGKNDPVSYAARVEAQSYGKITSRFLKTVRSDCPGSIKRAWVYDQLVAASLYHRLARVFPTSTDRFKDVFAAGTVYLLNTDDKKWEISRFGGLIHFAQNARMYMERSPDDFKDVDSIYFNRLLDVYGDFDNDTWLFWDKRWQHLFDRPHRLVILRRFLHAAFSTYVVSGFEQIFDLSKDDMLCYMDEFVSLAKDEQTQSKDVDAFISRLRFHFDMTTEYPGLGLLLEAPFYIVDMYYRECEGNPLLFQRRIMANAAA